MHKSDKTNDQFSLSGKHAVVTGAGGGIGSAIARQLHAQGAKVSLLGRNEAKLKSVARDLNDSQVITVDVSNAQSVTQAFEKARSSFGSIDILVNNAGVALSSPYLKQTPEQWQQTMAVNLDGVHFCTQAALPDMIGDQNGRKQWGRIINIASTAAQKGYAYVAGYVASKHAVLGLTRALAVEYANRSITINAVCPGFTDTEIVANALDNIMAVTGRSREAALSELLKDNPQKRLIQPEEVANVVQWLCLDTSNSITGQAISVAGGEVMS